MFTHFNLLGHLYDTPHDVIALSPPPDAGKVAVSNEQLLLLEMNIQ